MIRGARLLPAATLLALLAAAGGARAQRWSVSARAGRMTYDGAAATGASAGLLLGAGYTDRAGWLDLSAGIPLAQGDALWGGGGVGRRLALRPGPLILGIDLAGSGFVEQQRVTETTTPFPLPGPRRATTSDRTVHGWALAGEALPVAGVAFGPARLEARYGLSRFHAALDSTDRSRNVRLGDAALVLTPVPTVLLRAEARRYDAAEGVSAYGGAAAAVALSRLTLRGSVGSWLSGPGSGVPWSVGAELALSDRAGVIASAARDTWDPLYGIPAHTSWGIGLSYRLGAPDTPPAPVPAAYRNGTALIALPVDDSPERPRIAGDFNHWKPAPMQRDGGRWIYRVPIPPGVYHYAFVHADGTWFVPASVPGRTDDGMGGEVAVLVVRG